MSWIMSLTTVVKTSSLHLLVETGLSSHILRLPSGILRRHEFIQTVCMQLVWMANRSPRLLRVHSRSSYTRALHVWVIASLVTKWRATSTERSTSTVGTLVVGHALATQHAGIVLIHRWHLGILLWSSVRVLSVHKFLSWSFQHSSTGSTFSFFSK